MAKSLLQTIQDAVAPAKNAALIGTGKIITVLPKNRYVVRTGGKDVISSSATDEPIIVGKPVHFAQNGVTVPAGRKLLVLGSA